MVAEVANLTCQIVTAGLPLMGKARNVVIEVAIIEKQPPMAFLIRLGVFTSEESSLLADLESVARHADDEE